MTEGLVASHGADLYPLSEVMALADTAARRDPALVDRLTQGLTHSAEPMRYWAAMGLLILGPAAQTATDALTSTLANDSSPQVQIVAAEALAANGPHQNAVIAVLRRYLGGDNPLPVRLQPINALTCYGPSAEGASAEIEAAAVDENQYIRSAGGYLTSLQNGSLAPPNQFSTCSTCSNRCSAAPDGSEGGGTS